MTPCVSIVNLKEDKFIDFKTGKYNGQIDKAKQIPHGYGKLIEENKDEYRGNFLFGKKEGHGELFYSNGNCYIGRFKGDLFNGYGRFEYINGSFYEGNFFRGKRHGKGIYNNNCLLYTSPSPRDLSTSRMPSSA